jgi:hypothetical protein
MLAVLIASQSLVTLVAAAPFSTEMPEDPFYKQYAREVQEFKCFIAKDDKNACLNVSPADGVADDAVDFLARHGRCKAINSKIKLDFKDGNNIINVKDCPLEAHCYFRAGQCGELSHVSMNALCYGLKGQCKNAIDPTQCKQLYQKNVEAEQRSTREWEKHRAEWKAVKKRLGWDY